MAIPQRVAGEETMNRTCRSYIEVVGPQGTAFDRMVAVVRCHLIKLVNAINRLQFLSAWVESIELARSLDLAELSLETVPAADRSGADQRLTMLRGIAHRVQDIAQQPSATAILHVR